MIRSETHVCISCQMEHEIATLDCRSQRLRIQHIAFHNPKTRMRVSLFEEKPSTCREVVVTCDLMAGSHKSVRQIAPDKTGAAGYQAAQRKPSFVALCKKSL